MNKPPKAGVASHVVSPDDGKQDPRKLLEFMFDSIPLPVALAC